MINKVILVGNLGRDPEQKDIGGKKLTNFSIATTENFKDKNDEWQNITEWHDISIFGYCPTLSKGDRVYVEGKIKSREYTTNEGAKRKHFGIVANKVKNLTPKVAAPNNDSFNTPF